MTSKEERRLKLIAKFRAVAAERIAKIDASFGALESGRKDAALADEMMREIHTLKGEARLMGFAEVSQISHCTEDVLAWAMERGFQVSSKASDLVYAGLDLGRALLVEDVSGPDLAAKVGAMEADTKALIEGADKGDEAATDEPKSAPRGAAEAAPEPPRHDPGPRLMPAEVETKRSARGAPRADFVRIPSEALIDLSRVVSELALHQESMTRLLGEVQRLPRAMGDAGSRDILRALGDADFEARLRVDELRERVGQLRLLQVQTLFERYPSSIRELAAECGKKVRVLIEGASVAVDKQVLDQIDESLLHLVRNSVDHGIESPEERRSAGKAVQGTLVLGARQMGSQVEIRVEDDGRGLSPDRVRELASARGLIAPGQVLSDEDAFQLLFEPGFSTREEVTDISGRGVGLDVVKSRAESLGGSVRISSRSGRGTTISMRLPISVALGRSLLFHAGGTTFALPSTHVAGIARPRCEEIERIGRHRAFRLNGDPVPLLHLAPAICDVATSTGDSEAVNEVVVLEHAEQRLGLVVDSIVGERQTVHQAPARFLEGVSTSNGTVLLEGGHVAVVLNAPEVMRLWGEGHSPLPTSNSDRGESSDHARRRILIVDDSELTRDMLVGVASRWDLEIEEAVDGREALERIRVSTPDLILTDLDMPVMDGLALIEALRGQPLTKEIPIVVLSTRGSDDDKRRAMAAGADGYLVKLEFDESTFKQVLWRFLDG